MQLVAHLPTEEEMEQAQIQAQARAKQAHVLTVPGQREAVLTDAQGYQRSKPDTVVMDSLHTQTTPGKQAQTLHLYQTTVANTKNAGFNESTAQKQNAATVVETTSYVESYEAQLQSHQMDWEDTTYYKPRTLYVHGGTSAAPVPTAEALTYKQAIQKGVAIGYQNTEDFVVAVYEDPSLIPEGLWNTASAWGNGFHDFVTDSLSTGILWVAGKSAPPEIAYRNGQRLDAAGNLYGVVTTATGPEIVQFITTEATESVLTAGVGYGGAKLVKYGVNYGTYITKTPDVSLNVYHTTKTIDDTHKVLGGIDPEHMKDNNRFGKAFYVSEIPDTTLAELANRNLPNSHTIRYGFDPTQIKTLDLTNPRIAREWGYQGGEDHITPRAIAAKARQAGYNAIYYSSERGAGANLAILNNFDQALTPQMVMAAPGYAPPFNPNYHPYFGN